MSLQIQLSFFRACKKPLIQHSELYLANPVISWNFGYWFRLYYH